MNQFSLQRKPEYFSKKSKNPMKKILRYLMLLPFVLSSCEKEEMLSEAKFEPVTIPEFQLIEDQYIVVLKSPLVDLRLINDYAAKQNLFKERVLEHFSRYKLADAQILHVYESAVSGFTVKMGKAQLAEILNDPLVDYVEQDFVINLLPILRPILNPILGGGSSTPPSPPSQPAQTVPYGINRVRGGFSYTGTKTVYVVDTGVELDHPDLRVNAQKGFNAFSSGSDGQSVTDLNGHGTHVAGTIGAINNNIGVIGVAAGVEIAPVKVLGANGSGSNSGVIAGVNFIAANAKVGDIANMSLGGGTSTALDNAVLAASNKGIWFVLAAGNSSANAANSSPARVNGPFVVTVSAMNENDSFASFSNFGNPPIDWCAPGVNTTSTWINNSYRTISGTSMAAPHVAGILVLGEIAQDGVVRNDRDNTPDPIAVLK